MIYKALQNDDLNSLLMEVKDLGPEGFRLFQVFQEVVPPMTMLKNVGSWSTHRWVAVVQKYEDKDLEELWGKYTAELNLDN